MGSIRLSPDTPVIVTGGASGIGKACAMALAEAGRAIAIWDLDQHASTAVAEAISAQYGVQSVGIAIDLGHLELIADAVATTRNALGGIGGLIHAAGVDGVGMLEQLTPQVWENTLNVNLRSQVFIIKAILEDLKKQDGSAIVGIASINATLGNAMNPSYSASKGGLLGVSRALADDLARYDIRINCISPGQIDTPMLQGAMRATPGLREQFERRILMSRLAKPEEIARAARFLMSEEASYITATELVVDGGNISSQRH